MLGMRKSPKWSRRLLDVCARKMKPTVDALYVVISQLGLQPPVPFLHVQIV